MVVTVKQMKMGTAIEENRGSDFMKIKVKVVKEVKPKTMKEKFFETFPNAQRRHDNDLPQVCPFNLGWGEYNSDICIKNNCEDCWNMPYKE